MFGFNNNEAFDKEEYTDIIGQHLETFIAVFIRSISKLNNFAVGNIIEVEGEKYAYQFNLHREGTQGYRQIAESREQAQK